MSQSFICFPNQFRSLKELELLLPEMEKRNGKVALVTGASSGIGASIAVALAKAGMKVVGVARNKEAIESLASEVGKGNGSILALKCDLTKEEDIERVFEIIKQEYGGVDICINNAGTGYVNFLLDGSPEEWRYISDLNIIALCYCSKLATQSLVERNINDGHIINISSVAAHLSKQHGDLNFYGATKHAVKFITEGLRQEIIEKKYKIKVSSISPGYVDTDIFRRAMRVGDKNFNIQKHLGMEIMKSEDIADVVIYILSCSPVVEVNDVILRPVGQTTESFELILQ